MPVLRSCSGIIIASGRRFRRCGRCRGRRSRRRGGRSRGRSRRCRRRGCLGYLVFSFTTSGQHANGGGPRGHGEHSPSTKQQVLRHPLPLLVSTVPWRHFRPPIRRSAWRQRTTDARMSSAPTRAESRDTRTCHSLNGWRRERHAEYCHTQPALSATHSRPRVHERASIELHLLESLPSAHSRCCLRSGPTGPLAVRCRRYP